MEPLALDNTPLSIDAPAPRGPRTPWSPVRTPVRPPGRNPEEEPMLAGATGRRGATVVVEIFIHGAVKATVINAPQSQLNK